MSFIKYIFSTPQQIVFTLSTSLALIFVICLYISGEQMMCLVGGLPFFANIIGDYFTYKKLIKDGVYNKKR